MWEEREPLKTEAKKRVSRSSPCRLTPALPSYLPGRYIFFYLPCLSNIPVDVLLVSLRIPCQTQRQLCLSFPDPIPTYPGSVPIFFPGYVSLLPLPARFLLALQFEQETFTQPCWSPGFLARFLIFGKRELLCSKKNVLKELPALFSSFIPECSVPRDPICRILRQPQVRSPQNSAS